MKVLGSIFNAKDWASSKCKLCDGRGTYDDNTNGGSKFHTYLQGPYKINKYRQRSADVNDDTFYLILKIQGTTGVWNFWRITFGNRSLRQNTTMMQ